MTTLLLYTSAYFFFAVTAVLLCQKFGLGSVLGYLLAGILIGPAFGIVGKEAESIQHIAECGHDAVFGGLGVGTTNAVANAA